MFIRLLSSGLVSDHAQTHNERWEFYRKEERRIGRCGGGDGSGKEEMKGGWKGLLDEMGAERSEGAGEAEAQGGGGLV